MDEEKRRSIRITKPLTAQFGVKKDGPISWDMGRINDIGEYGICLYTSVPLQKEAHCFLKIRMPIAPRKRLDLTGKVVESFKSKSKANICTTRLEFLNLDEEQKETLREYIAWALVNERGEK